MPAPPDPSPETTSGFRFPSAFSILFALIVLIAALTWIIPAGQYARVASEALGKDVPVAGSYAPTEANPQGIFDVILAPIAGFYDPDSYAANAIDVSLFVLIIGGFIGVVTATGAIDAGIARAMVRLKGRENWMIPFLMALFALGGTTYGMAEETLAFYVLLIPVMIAAGYDALVGVAVIMLGAGIGVLGSTINAFSTVIASDAAGVTFADGDDPSTDHSGRRLADDGGLRDALCRAGQGGPIPFARVRQEGRERGAFPPRQGDGGNRIYRPAPDRAGPVRADLCRDDLGRLKPGLVDGADVGAVPNRRHSHRDHRATGRGAPGRGLYERCA
jgi:C4-dicarboxylate anaerobic carrier